MTGKNLAGRDEPPHGSRVHGSHRAQARYGFTER